MSDQQQRCSLCNDWTEGSRSVNGNFCACLCPECRAVEDKAAEMTASNFAAVVDQVLDPIPLATEMVS